MSEVKGAFGTTFHADVNQRNLPKLGDAEQTQGSSAEAGLAKTAARNAIAVPADAFQVAIDVASVGIGTTQTATGAFSVLKDLFDAGVSKVPDILSRFDREIGRLQAEGELQGHEQLKLERMKKVRANLEAIKQEDWPLIKEGLERIVKGAGFAVIDVASMSKDTAEALLNILEAGGVVARKAISATGVAAGRGLYATGVAAKDAAMWAADKTWDGMVWTGDKAIAGAVAVQDGFVWAGGKAVDGAVAVKDGVVWAGGKAVDGAVWIGNVEREAYEDTMAAIATGAASQANKAANVAPRFELKPLPDHAAQEQ